MITFPESTSDSKEVFACEEGLGAGAGVVSITSPGDDGQSARESHSHENYLGRWSERTTSTMHVNKSSRARTRSRRQLKVKETLEENTQDQRSLELRRRPEEVRGYAT